MFDSLLTSQFLRLLKSSDKKSVAHIAYWIGDSLGDLRSGIDSGPHPCSIPEYFATIESMIVFGRIDDIISPGNWRHLTNRMIYINGAKSFPVPKVELEAGFTFSRVWQLINHSILTPSAQDISFLLVHNKLPVSERLYRIGLKQDPHCDKCLGLQVNDIEHFFCLCSKVALAWSWVRSELTSLIGADVPNASLVRYMFPKSPQEKEVVWLLGNYVEMVWTTIHVNNEEVLKWEELFGFLKFKYRADQLGARHELNPIPGLM